MCQDPTAVPVIFDTKFQARIPVLDEISSKVDVMPPHFFGKIQNVTNDVYSGAINAVGGPGKPWLYQQDRALVHMSNLVRI